MVSFFSETSIKRTYRIFSELPRLYTHRQRLLKRIRIAIRRCFLVLVLFRPVLVLDLVVLVLIFAHFFPARIMTDPALTNILRDLPLYLTIRRRPALLT